MLIFCLIGRIYAVFVLPLILVSERISGFPAGFLRVSGRLPILCFPESERVSGYPQQSSGPSLYPWEEGWLFAQGQISGVPSTGF